MEESIPCLPKPFFVAPRAKQYRQFSFWWYARLICSLAFLAQSCCGIQATLAQELSNERFGSIKLFRQDLDPAYVVLFLSDKNGFDKANNDLANAITKNDALVIGIDSARYIQGIQSEDSQEDCSYLAGELTRLSQAAQSASKLSSYKKPLLFGVGSGASLAYTIASQFSNEFTGLITQDFCPSLPNLHKLCAGEGLVIKENIISKESSMPLAWRNFSQSPDCAQSYLKTANDQLLSTEAIFSDEFFKMFRELASQDDPESKLEAAVSDLPLVEIFPEQSANKALIVIFSGDGGWAKIDQELADRFLAAGHPVLGFNVLKYFWTKRDPDQTAADVNRALRFYRTKLGIEEIELVGFSFGADILPFIYNRLSADNKTDTTLVALLSPGKKTDFEVHVADWLGIATDDPTLDVTAEISKITNRKVLCLSGQDDLDQTCSILDASKFKLKQLPGDHHFNGDYDTLSRLILAED